MKSSNQSKFNVSKQSLPVRTGKSLPLPKSSVGLANTQMGWIHIVLFVIIISVAAAIGVDFYLRINNEARISAQLNENSIHLVHDLESNTNKNTMLSVLAAVAERSPSIQEFLNNPQTVDQAAPLTALEAIRKNIDAESGFITNAHGKVLLSSLGYSNFDKDAQRGAFEAVSAGVESVYFEIDEYNNRWIVMLVPIYSQHTETFIGMVGMRHPSAAIDGIFLSLPAISMFVSPEGFVFNSSIVEWRMHYLEHKTPEQQTLVDKQSNFIQYIPKKPTNTLRTQTKGDYFYLNGESYLYQSQRILINDSKGPWQLILLERPDSGLSIYKRLYTALAIFFGVLVLLSGCYYALLTRTRSRSIISQNALLSAAMDVSPIGITITDGGGQILYVNDFLCLLFNRKPEDVIASDINTIIGATNEGNDSFEDFKSALRGKDSHELCSVLNGPQEENLIVKTTASKITRSQSIEHYYLFLHENITADVKRSNELKTAKERAEGAAKTKSMFLANMSHEIRTPLNGILGIAMLLNKSVVEPKNKSYLSKIIQSGQHLLGIINDILDFSKIEAGSLKVDKIEFQLGNLLEGIRAMVGKKAEEKHLSFNIKIADGIPDTYIGDPLRINQILINFTSNAIKFTSDGFVNLEVSQLRRSGNKTFLRFAVIDSGIGLSTEQISRLFSAFEQADSSTTRQYGGTGLGLAISRRLATIMGGQVGVKSRLGEGSEFWLELCLQEANDSVAKAADKDMSGRHFIIIDDDPVEVKLISHYLEEAGSNAHGFVDGGNALNFLRRQDDLNQTPDFMFVDLVMPNMGGLEIIRQVKSLNLRKQPGMIMFTAFDREDIIESALSAGYSDVLIKPLHPAAIYKAIRRIEQPHPNSMEASISIGNKLNGIKVLLVEDNELNQLIASEMLSDHGMLVDIAENGKIATEKVYEKKYGVILMDMQMPVMDGLEATRIIRSDPSFSKLPIIAMTANAMSIDRDNCLNAGMNEHITKPITPKQLIQTIAQFVISDKPTTPKEDAMDDKTPLNTELLHNEKPLNLIQLLQSAGFDTDFGMRATNNNIGLYKRLIVMFEKTCKEVQKNYPQSMANDDRTAARITIHSLKGSAASIGASAIAHYADALEQAIINEQTETQMMPIYADLDAAIQGIIPVFATINETA